VIGFYGISGRNVVVFCFCNFEPLNKMLAARNVMKCAARMDWHLAFGISRSNIYRFQPQASSNEGSDGVYNGHCQLRTVSSPIDYLNLP
jgi:hypothetical protein